MGMRIDEYMKPADEAIEAEPVLGSEAYLGPALVGALGAVMSGVANSARFGQDTTASVRSGYKSLALHALLALRVSGLDPARVNEVTPLRFTEDRDAALELLLSRVSSVARSGADTLGPRAAGLVVALVDHAEVVTGKTLGEILES